MLKEILIEILNKENCRIEFDFPEERLTKLFREKCLLSLSNIKAALEDGSLNDYECVEQIISVFSALGIGVDRRHDGE